MATAKIALPPKLKPVFLGDADFRGAWGGRGSGKSRSFALMSAVRGYQLAQAGLSGVIVCGREYQNTLAESSMAEVKAAIESQPWLAANYEIGDSYIRTSRRGAKGKIDYAFAGLRKNLGNIKSTTRIRLLWIDEAEPVSDDAWEIALPTVREEGSETWVTWNPSSKRSATHRRFRVDAPANSKIVELNWRDNPWFTSKLERQRLDDLQKRPESYQHVWEGDFATIVTGAYYAKLLLDAQQSGRICHVGEDPLQSLRAYWDIGGTGARADACAIWIVQFCGAEVRALDYYEASGQPLGTHIEWLRKSGYERAECVLPHDGAQHDKVYQVTYESALKGAGFATRVVPNMGAGAASRRIEAARRVFPSVLFNDAKTEPGRDALGAYHEKVDAARGIGLGPDHDWSSHCADAWGLACVDYLATPKHDWKPIKYKPLSIV